MQKPSAIVLGTGRRLLYGDAGWRVYADKSDRASVISGALPITVEAFVEFDAGKGYERAVTTAATAVLWPGEDHTTELTRVATMEIPANDDPAAALSLWGFQVSRWQATSAPHRLELDPDLARRLSLDQVAEATLGEAEDAAAPGTDERHITGRRSLSLPCGHLS